MFTSRSEFRLTLRPDNADQRLTKKGFDIGLVSAERFKRAEFVRAKIFDKISLLKDIEKTCPTWQKLLKPYCDVRLANHGSRNAFDVLSMEGIALDTLVQALSQDLPSDFLEDSEISRRLKIEASYSNVVEAQSRDIDRLRKELELKIPKNFNFYDPKLNLSVEEKEKLTEFQPTDIASAGRINGVTPSTVIRLMYFLKKQREVSSNAI